jgi:hypothetical protein
VQRVVVLLHNFGRAQFDKQHRAEPDQDGIVDRADGEIDRHDPVGECAYREQLQQRADARVTHQAQDQLQADSQLA